VTIDRVRAIDAARGTAMLFVFLSHFGLVYFAPAGARFLYAISEGIGMVATPTFMIISGIMLGYLFQTRRERFEVIRRKLMDRGLFYLLVGHFLISCSQVSRAGGWLSATSCVFITDMIGFCMIGGPRLLEHCGPRFRIGLGAFLYLFSWLLSLSWSPSSAPGELVHGVLFGNVDWLQVRLQLHLYTFPLLPWFSVYIASTAIGEHIASCQMQGKLRQAGTLLKLLFMWTLGLAALSMAALTVARAQGWIARVGMSEIFARYQKLPPGPIYLLFYGGTGFAILYLLFLLPNRAPWKGFISFTTLLGQTSFFIFVLQYFVFYMLVFPAHLAYTPLWPVYLVGSVAFITGCAWLWRARRFNRYLTLRPIR
jgi:hypothetical protein